MSVFGLTTLLIVFISGLQVGSHGLPPPTRQGSTTTLDEKQPLPSLFNLNHPSEMSYYYDELKDKDFDRSAQAYQSYGDWRYGKRYGDGSLASWRQRKRYGDSAAALWRLKKLYADGGSSWRYRK